MVGGRALAGGTADVFLKVDGVEGESTASGFAGQVDVKSFGFELENSSTGGSGQGSTTVGTFKFTKFVDKSSPVLAKRAAQGLSTVVAFSFVRSTPAGARTFMTVRVAGFVKHWEVGGEREPALLERVELRPTRYCIAYRPVDASGGLGGEIRFNHNVATTEISTTCGDYSGL